MQLITAVEKIECQHRSFPGMGGQTKIDIIKCGSGLLGGGPFVITIKMALRGKIGHRAVTEILIKHRRMGYPSSGQQTYFRRDR